MTKSEFEKILTECCTELTKEARSVGFKASAQFENRVREILAKVAKSNKQALNIEFNPRPQAFPDIAMGEYGVEVKFTSTPSTDNAYQNNLDQTLLNQESAAADDEGTIAVVFHKEFYG